MPSWAFGRANHKTAVIARGNAAGPAQLLNLSASLGGTGHTREAVRRPPGEDADSWVASQTLLVFQHVDLLWELLGDGCAPELPMTAGSSAEYLLPRDLALEASDDVVDQGFVLLCCSEPVNDDVKITTVDEDELLEVQLRA